jgi:hypothetical protein
MYIFPAPSSFQQLKTIAKMKGKGEWQMDKRLQKAGKRLLTNFVLGADAPTRLNFANQLLCPQVSVSEEHPRVSVTRDHRNLCDI